MNNTIEHPSTAFLEGLPNATKLTYSLQHRKTEDGKNEYRFIGSDGVPFGRVFSCSEEAPEVMREYLHSQVDKSSEA